MWVRTLLDLLATALAERAKKALGISTLVGSSSKLVRWSGLAAASGGVLLIAYGVLSWVIAARLYGEYNDLGGVKLGPQWALGLMQGAGYLLFFGGSRACSDRWSAPDGPDRGRQHRPVASV